VLVVLPNGPGPRCRRVPGSEWLSRDHVDRSITGDSQQPCAETASVLPLEPIGDRGRNRHEYFLNQIVRVRRLKATARGDVEYDRTINRRELFPCSHIFCILKTQNEAGSGLFVSWIHGSSLKGSLRFKKQD